MLERDKTKVKFQRHAVERYAYRVRDIPESQILTQLRHILMASKTSIKKDRFEEFAVHVCGDLHMVQRGSIIKTIYIDDGRNKHVDANLYRKKS